MFLAVVKLVAWHLRIWLRPTAKRWLARAFSLDKFVTEYRSLLQQNTDCLKIMREALELFINTGWPSARRLSYRVDEIFR